MKPYGTNDEKRKNRAKKSTHPKSKRRVSRILVCFCCNLWYESRIKLFFLEVKKDEGEIFKFEWWWEGMSDLRSVRTWYNAGIVKKKMLFFGDFIKWTFLFMLIFRPLRLWKIYRRRRRVGHDYRRWNR